MCRHKRAPYHDQGSAQEELGAIFALQDPAHAKTAVQSALVPYVGTGFLGTIGQDLVASIVRAQLPQVFACKFLFGAGRCKL
jgi:hypothetical protein